MQNPWLEIPLEDLEGHMSLPAVDQTRLVADGLKEALRTHRPGSVAVVGCAGGKGLENIDPQVTRRVVAIDINPSYVAAVRERFGGTLPMLETYVADVQATELPIEPVELVYAALVLEFVDVAQAFDRLAAICAPGGVLVTVTQRPSAAIAAITPSPFASMQSLASLFRFVSRDTLSDAAARTSLILVSENEVASSSGKRFAVCTFRQPGD